MNGIVTRKHVIDYKLFINLYININFVIVNVYKVYISYQADDAMY